MDGGTVIFLVGATFVVGYGMGGWLGYRAGWQAAEDTDTLKRLVAGLRRYAR